MAYLIIDLEMTGPDPEFHDFIQIGAVLANDRWKLLDTFQTMVYPDNEDAYSTYAEQVHGISIHELYDAPQSFEAIEMLEEWVMNTLNMRSTKALRSVVVAGHSVYHDVSFLKAKYFVHRIDWKFAYRLLDLTNIAYVVAKVLNHNKFKFTKAYSLDAIAQAFGIERQTEQHDALEDAKITYLCFKKFFDIINSFTFDPEQIQEILNSEENINYDEH